MIYNMKHQETIDKIALALHFCYNPPEGMARMGCVFKRFQWRCSTH